MRSVPALLAALAGALTVVGTAATIGLLGGPVRGAADNADGARLLCRAGLRPDTPEGTAAWRGVVVTEFTTGHPTCGAPVSSAARILAATVPEGAGTWSLTTLGWTYLVLLGLGAGLAAGALGAVAARRALLVAIPVLPLVVVPWWSRFTVSTYGEPAGLLGAVWLLLGLLVVAATPPTARVSRLAALLLIASGGLVAATAKPGYLPLGLLAVAALLVVAVGTGRRARAPGPIAAALVVALAAVPVSTALTEQQRTYGAINAHHLVFTLLLPEVGPGVLPRVGLPAQAAVHSGESFYWAGARGIPGWDEAIGSRPADARGDALAVLAAHPGVALGAVHTAMSATLRPQLPYLPSAPRGTAPERDELRTLYPETGALGDVQRRWLEGITAAWLPTAFAALVVVAGLAALVAPPRRPRARPRSPAAGLVVVAGASAACAVALCALTVVGDGFYELTKHVWPASYLVAVSALVAVTAAVAGLVGRLSARRSSTPGPPRTGAGTGR